MAQIGGGVKHLIGLGRNLVLRQSPAQMTRRGVALSKEQRPSDQMLEGADILANSGGSTGHPDVQSASSIHGSSAEEPLARPGEAPEVEKPA